MSIGQALLRARQTAKVTVDELADWASVNAEELASFEAGRLSLNRSHADQCARALGLRLEDLEGGDLHDPLPLLLRTDTEGEFNLHSQIASREILLALGEFQRTVRNVDMLEKLLAASPRKESLGTTQATLPLLNRTTVEYGGARGEKLAARARDALGLGIEPIASMRRLVEGLGVSTIWVTSDHLPQSIDGASTSFPRPAVLINLVEVNRHPWRVRTTLAHELCHVLFDHRARQTLLSPATPTGALADLETVARAFSACFLAPTEGVERTVGTIAPTSEAAICCVGETFGVGRTVAINRLTRVFKLSDVDRDAMMRRSPTHYRADFAGDVVESADGFSGDPLRALVGKALGSELIGPRQARMLLGLTGVDALPFENLGELCAPTTSKAEVARRAAQAELRTRFPTLDLEAMSSLWESGAFRVAVMDGGVAGFDRHDRGHILVSESGVVVDVKVA